MNAARPRRTSLVARPVTLLRVRHRSTRGELAAIYGVGSVDFCASARGGKKCPPSVTQETRSSTLRKIPPNGTCRGKGKQRTHGKHPRRPPRRISRCRSRERKSGFLVEPTLRRREMACRSRALVRAAREATRTQAWRVLGTRGLASSPARRARVDPTASVHPRARLAPDTALGPFCVVSAGAVVGPGCRLGAGVHLLGDVELGAGCVLRSHAVVGAEVRRARRVARDAPETRARKPRDDRRN